MTLFHVKLAIAVLFIAWAVSCWLAPISFLRNRVELRTRDNPVLFLGLHDQIRQLGIRFYLVEDLPGYAFSCWHGFHRIVVIKESFWRFAPEASVRFVIAHEVGHHHLGHPALKLALTATLLAWVPTFRRVLDMSEHHANVFAEQLTGFPRSIVWGVGMQSVAGGPGTTEESKPS